MTENFAKKIILDDSTLTVSRKLPNGQCERWLLEPYWASACLRQEHGCTHVILRSNSLRLSLGHYLTDDEKNSVLKEIQTALYDWKRRPAASVIND